MSINDQIYICRQLSTLMSSGLTLYESVSVLSEEKQSKHVAVFLFELKDRVGRGENLSHFFEEKKWKNMAITLAKVGETSGSLSDSLREISAELTRSYDMKKKALSALIYPACIASFATLLVCGIVSFIFPKIIPILKSVQGELPISTKIVIFISHTISHYGFLILFFAATIILVSFFSFKRFTSVKTFFEKILLTLPLVGRFYRSYILSNIFRSCSILTSSGVSLIDTIEVTVEHLATSTYSKALTTASDEMVHGSSFSEALKKYPTLFPTLSINLILVGERTGTLSSVCGEISRIYSEQFQSDVESVSKLLEPLLMVVLGCVVGFIAISIISPIYEITSHVKR